MNDQERFLKQPHYYHQPSQPSPYALSPRDPFEHFTGIAYQADNNYALPPYDGSTNTQSEPPHKRKRGSLWKPRTWSKKTWYFLGVILLAVLLVIILAAVETAQSAVYPNYKPLDYKLTDTFSGSDFFSNNFQYWDTYDPAGGFVHYDNPTDSTVTYNTTFASGTSAVLRVDNKQTNASTGRHSARVSSLKTYASGLFVFDILHFPTGCATWPAVWLTDQYSWPKNGEIDVVEAINQANVGNQMTLHTTKDCSMNVRREMTGQALYANCLNSTEGNSGCGVRGAQDTYGESLNNAGGGVYAMELRPAGIRVWFWNRTSVPGDLSYTNASAIPEPQTWGRPLADFPSTDCDIGSHFRNLSIVANIDVCGSWAGDPKAYNVEDKCPGQCTEYAAVNPQAFDDAYWEFKSFRVWQASFM